MSNSKINSKLIIKSRFSVGFIWVMSLVLVTAALILGLLYARQQKIDFALFSPKSSRSKLGSNISYDKNQILVDDTTEPLEIVEISDL